MKHTPGPWHRKPGANDNGAIHGGPDKRGVASVHFQENPERYEANAVLIASAPELLQALQDLVNRVDSTPIKDGSNLDTAWAHALLARIEGD